MNPNQSSFIFHGNPNQIAIIEQFGQGKSRSILYEELNKEVQNFSLFLMDQNINQNHTVGLYMIRSVEHVLALATLLSWKYPFFSMSSKYPVKYLDKWFNQCQTDVLLIDQNTLIKFSQCEKSYSQPFKIILLKSNPLSEFQRSCVEKISSQYDLVVYEWGQSKPKQIRHPEFKIKDKQNYFILFTSGSTGTPKGVMVSYEDVEKRVDSEIKSYQLTSSGRLLSLLPFSFDVGLNQMLASLACGSTLVILNSWFPKDIAHAVKEHQITGISAVPSIWRDILSLPSPEIQNSFQSLRYLAISGGNLPKHELQRMYQKFHWCDIYKTYGQTETFRSAMLLPHEYETKMESVGKPLPEVKVFVADEDHQEVSPGTEGEIIHRGMGSMLGYLNNIEGTSNKFRNYKMDGDLYETSYIATGDTGYFDEDGYLYIVGRKDSMLKIQGNRFYPNEIEQVLMNHKNVFEAVILVMGKEEREVSLVAMIQPQDGANVDAEALRAFAIQNLPPFMVPQQYGTIEQFPRTANGKVDRNQLRTCYLNSIHSV